MKFFKSRQMTSAEEQVEDLKAQSATFKLPKPNPWIFYMGKGAAFVLLAGLNFYVFHHVVPGAFGVAIGIIAIVTEVTALYLWQIAHNCVGRHKAGVIVFAVKFTAFSLFHAFVGFLTLRGAEFPWMENYSGYVAFPMMLALWLTCVILVPLLHPNSAVVAERSRQETRIAIEQQKTLAFASKLRQEALQTRLQLDSKQEEATLSRDVLKVAQEVAQGRLASRSFADSIPDSEVRHEITDMLGIEDRGAAKPKAPTPTFFDAGKPGSH
jgi:hypothetical protein